MRKTLLILLMTSIPSLAQSVFDGTWRLSLGDAQVNVTEKFLLHDGLYSCWACDPPLQDFKADGQPHPSSGSPYYDAVTVRVIDDRTVDYTTTKNGKLIDHQKLTVSADNKQATRDETFTSQNGQLNHERDLWKRTADAPAGAHKISGTWQPEKIEEASDSLRNVTFKATENGLIWQDGQGDSFDAKFDGKDYPYNGDPGTTSVLLNKIDDHTVEESDKRDGKTLYIWRWSVEPGGKSMKIAIQDKMHNTTLSFTATKL